MQNSRILKVEEGEGHKIFYNFLTANELWEDIQLF